jgi:phosphoribosylanthranilate isomerase
MIRVKICGITSSEDAQAASYFGADAIGLNFYPPSPRCISLQVAQSILSGLSPFTTSFGIFVNQPQDEIRQIATSVGLRGVQTYTEASLSEHFFPLAWMPAFRVATRDDLDAARAFLKIPLQWSRPPVAAIIDSRVDGEMGGTGHPAPWELLADLDLGLPILLAGGLTPDNVAEAIQIVKPMGVDVASGVESAPGKKDPGKIRAFVENARQAGAKLRKAKPTG